MLGAARKELVQSFGVEPQTVVEHCLAANRIRQERDTRLTVVMGVFGLLFLPGDAALAAAPSSCAPWSPEGRGLAAGRWAGVVLAVVGAFAVLFAGQAAASPASGR